MKDEATPEQLAMARRIWHETTAVNDPVQAILAAIIETQRADAELADNFATKRGFANADCLDLATAIRAGKHYGNDQQ